MNLIERSCPKKKTSVRDAIRRGPGGDAAWQRVQAEIYGPGIFEAEIAPGFPDFIRKARSSGAVIYIVSHKSQFSNLGESRENLRSWATEWMEKHSLFSMEGLGFTKEEIFFESTRANKIARIGALDCQVFIDDLIEVFEEPDFPKTVDRILFSNEAGSGPLTRFETWDVISEFLLVR